MNVKIPHFRSYDFHCDNTESFRTFHISKYHVHVERQPLIDQ